MRKIKSKIYIFIGCAALMPVAVGAEPAAVEDKPLELFIRGALRGQSLKDLPSGAVLVGERALTERGARNFEEAIPLIPGLTFVGGTSRPRFLQIRGVGEYEQYEGAPNPSVGFFIDDFNLSGIGIGSDLFDVESVQVLKGPQAAAMGGSALAGAVRINTKDPRAESEVILRGGLGSDGLWSSAGSATGKIFGLESATARITAQRNYQNGFIHNNFLDSDSTNKRDESTLRGKIFLGQDDFRLKLSALGINGDNGYDAFSIDNGFETESDRPGQDALDAAGGSAKIEADLEGAALQNTLTRILAKQKYSFDGDWGNNDFWGEFAPYDYFSSTRRERRVVSNEARISSPDSAYIHGETSRRVMGVFVENLNEDALVSQFSEGEIYDSLDSGYASRTRAVFAEDEEPIAAGASISGAIRLERKTADYSDSRLNALKPGSSMLGGNLTFKRDIAKSAISFASLSRGFKAGGVNVGLGIPSSEREFEPEYLWNLETGLRGSAWGGKIRGGISGFAGRRTNAQLKLSTQTDPSDPLTFVYLTDNAAEANIFGIDAELNYEPAGFLSFGGAGSLMGSKFFDTPEQLSYLSGRAEASAPLWQGSLGIKARLSSSSWLRTDVFGRGRSYFDESSNQASKAYSILNASLGFDAERASIVFWVRNIFNKRYAVRGFYFGNEPPDFPNKLYVQWGEPLAAGVSVEARF